MTDMDNEVTTTAVVVHEEQLPVQQWTPRLVVTVDDAVAQVHQRDEFMQRVMREGLDYGVIPGTGTKPTLYKPGAERLLTSYGLYSELANDGEPVLDWSGADHGGEVFLLQRTICRIWRQTGPAEHDRMMVAAARGICTSWESKYRYRSGGRTCPDCGEAAIIKGKKEYGGGWVCLAKKGGCGQKWRDGDQVIEGQSTGRVVNPDPADVLNTVLKMADKRALVAATIIATGWSDLVTQDVEDFASFEAREDSSATDNHHATPPPKQPAKAPGLGDPAAIMRGYALIPGEAAGARQAIFTHAGFPGGTAKPLAWLQSLTQEQREAIHLEINDLYIGTQPAQDASVDPSEIPA